MHANSIPFRCLVLVLALGATACSSTDVQLAEERARKAAEERPEDKIELARLELRIAEMKSVAEEREASGKVFDAQQAVDEARLELETFRQRERVQELQSKGLEIDRAAYQAEEAEAELGELESMYREEEFAQTTKELVLRRGRMQREFAQRDLALKKDELAKLSEMELPKRERELEHALEKAERELREAQEALERQRLESKVAVMQKRHELEELLDESDAKSAAAARGAADAEEDSPDSPDSADSTGEDYE